MKTFEEKWTAWLDGQLSGRELAEFEASLPDKAAAEAEKREAKKLGALLKEEIGARRLSNEEFFSHQLRERIARQEAAPPRRRDVDRPGWWTIPRFFWVGATSLALFVISAVLVMRDRTPPEQSQYLTQILNARVDPTISPNASLYVFEAKQDRVTIIWSEGLQSLPVEYATK
jgi:anti-sigma factor RsiW